MDDPIEQLLEKIKGCDDIINTEFTNKFLNTVGEVFERDGFGAARIFLMERSERNELREQANTLLKVLELMQNTPEIHQRRSIGRIIFKAIIAFKN